MKKVLLIDECSNDVEVVLEISDTCEIPKLLEQIEKIKENKDWQWSDIIEAINGEAVCFDAIYV